LGSANLLKTEYDRLRLQTELGVKAGPVFFCCSAIQFLAFSVRYLPLRRSMEKHIQHARTLVGNETVQNIDFPRETITGDLVASDFFNLTPEQQKKRAEMLLGKINFPDNLNNSLQLLTVAEKNLQLRELAGSFKQKPELGNVIEQFRRSTITTYHNAIIESADSGIVQTNNDVLVFLAYEMTALDFLGKTGATDDVISKFYTRSLDNQTNKTIVGSVVKIMKIQPNRHDILSLFASILHVCPNAESLLNFADRHALDREFFETAITVNFDKPELIIPLINAYIILFPLETDRLKMIAGKFLKAGAERGKSHYITKQNGERFQIPVSNIDNVEKFKRCLLALQNMGIDFSAENEDTTNLCRTVKHTMLELLHINSLSSSELIMEIITTLQVVGVQKKFITELQAYYDYVVHLAVADQRSRYTDGYSLLHQPNVVFPLQPTNN
jgi:hypothetical protein